MERNELIELHYITPIANVHSILKLGILSHNLVKRVTHESVAMNEIQDRRANVTIPRGRKLHCYVNLYICARNPMMYKRRAQHQDLCVLKINPDVIDLTGVVITDRNASSAYASFRSAPAGLSFVNYELTFAENWIDSDEIVRFRKTSAKCAEVLVPDTVKPDYISGAYVSCQEAVATCKALNIELPILTNKDLFFR